MNKPKEHEAALNILIASTVYDNTKYSQAACNRLARLLSSQLIKFYKLELKKP